MALPAIGYLLGYYIYKIYSEECVALMRIFASLEQLPYRVMGVDKEQQMHAKKYAFSVLWLSLSGLLTAIGLYLIQVWLLLSPKQLESASVYLACNAVASSVSGTNWQAYSGKIAPSYLTQTAGLVAQNSVSAATGITVLLVLYRGLACRETKSFGNF